MVDVSEDGSGTITVNSSNLAITGSSELTSETNQTSATNNLGGINIKTENLTVTEGSRIQTVSTSAGAAGNIEINASKSGEISGYNPEGRFSGILSYSATENSGAGGNIIINPEKLQASIRLLERGFIGAGTNSKSDGGAIALNVNTLEILDGGQIVTFSRGGGKAGEIVVNAAKSITLGGTSYGFPFSGIDIHNLDEIEASTEANPDVEASGEGGIPYISVERTATEIKSGDRVFETAKGGRSSYFSFTITEAGSQAIFDVDYGSNQVNFETQEGVLTKTDTQIFLFNAATGELIETNDDSDVAQGAAGSRDHLDSYLNHTFEDAGVYILGIDRFGSNVNQNTAPILIKEGIYVGETYTLHFSLENQGKSSLPNTPFNPNFDVRSAIVSVAENEGTGGEINLNTGQLILTDDARIFSQNLGTAKGGNLNIAAELIEITDSKLEVQPHYFGLGGTINIQTGNLIQANGRILTNNAVSTGGDINIKASDSVELFTDSRIESEGRKIGIAGNINIDTGSLLVSGSRISPNSFDKAEGGNLTILASELVELKESSFIEVESYFSTGDAGDLTIKTGRLVFKDNSSISTTTTSLGNGGNTQIIAKEVELNDNSNITTETRGKGNAGNLVIETENLILNSGSNLITSSRSDSTGNGGDLIIKASEEVNLDNYSSLEAINQGSGRSGNINLETGKLILTNNAQISTATTGTSPGGDIKITATDAGEITNSLLNSSAELNDNNSQGSKNATGGNINITTPNLILSEGGRIQALTTSSGAAGNVELNVNSQLHISGVNVKGFASGVITSSETPTSGAGGNI